MVGNAVEDSCTSSQKIELSQSLQFHQVSTIGVGSYLQGPWCYCWGEHTPTDTHIETHTHTQRLHWWGHSWALPPPLSLCFYCRSWPLSLGCRGRQRLSAEILGTGEILIIIPPPPPLFPSLPYSFSCCAPFARKRFSWSSGHLAVERMSWRKWLIDWLIENDESSRRSSGPPQYKKKKKKGSLEFEPPCLFAYWPAWLQPHTCNPPKWDDDDAVVKSSPDLLEAASLLPSLLPEAIHKSICRLLSLHFSSLFILLLWACCPEVPNPSPSHDKPHVPTCSHVLILTLGTTPFAD